VTTGEYPLLYVFVIFVVRDDNMSGEVGGDQGLFLFLNRAGFILHDGWGGHQRKGWCICEKVEIYISAQQTIQMRLSMECCVGVYYFVEAALFHPLHITQVPSHKWMAIEAISQPDAQDG
jgi:hypothetical protein